ncbi:MAG: PIN domain nuclease [Chthoniobacterales bacterium]
MTLTDTSVWIDYFNGVGNWQTDRLDALLGAEVIVMGDLVLAEILQGFRSDADYQRAKTLLIALPFFPLAGYERALATAANYRLLKKRGLTVRKTVDVFIATACLDYDFELLHNDRDFEAMEPALGLRLVKMGS